MHPSVPIRQTAALALICALGLGVGTLLWGHPSRPVPLIEAPRDEPGGEPSAAIAQRPAPRAAHAPRPPTNTPETTAPETAIVVLDARNGAVVAGADVLFTTDPMPDDPAARDPSRILARAQTDARGVAIAEMEQRPWCYARCRTEGADGAALMGQLFVTRSEDSHRDPSTLWLHPVMKPPRLRVVDGLGLPVPDAMVTWSIRWSSARETRRGRRGSIQDRTDERGIVRWPSYHRLARQWRRPWRGETLEPPELTLVAATLEANEGIPPARRVLRRLPTPGEDVLIQGQQTGRITVFVFGPDRRPLAPGTFRVSAETLTSTGKPARILGVGTLRRGRAVLGLIPTDRDAGPILLRVQEHGGRTLAVRRSSRPSLAAVHVEATIDMAEENVEVVTFRLIDRFGAPLRSFAANLEIHEHTTDTGDLVSRKSVLTAVTDTEGRASTLTRIAPVRRVTIQPTEPVWQSSGAVRNLTDRWPTTSRVDRLHDLGDIEIALRTADQTVR